MDRIILITVGAHSYSSDLRYSLHRDHADQSCLNIEFVNKNDEGLYECQVALHPDVRFHINLQVNVPKIEIVNDENKPIFDKHYTPGSTIELKCIVNEVTNSTSRLIWKHEDHVLNTDLRRGGISVKTEKTNGGANSRLFIANANKEDAGNYTCSTENMTSVRIYVHILNGDNPEAVYGKSVKAAYKWPQLLPILLTMLDYF